MPFSENLSSLDKSLEKSITLLLRIKVGSISGVFYATAPPKGDAHLTFMYARFDAVAAAYIRLRSVKPAFTPEFSLFSFLPWLRALTSICQYLIRSAY